MGESRLLRLKNHQMKLRFLGFSGWLAFCYLFSAYIKLLLAGSFERFFFHWDAPLWMFLHCLIGALIIGLVRRQFKLLSVNSVSMNRDFLILVSLIPFIALTNTFLTILNEQHNFGKSHTLYNWTTAYLIEIVLMSVVGLSCISYFYISTVNEIKNRLSAAQLAQSDMQLKILQQKVNPHFLFNNLNVLSSLVEKNPKVAAEFTTRLAELYRYILKTQNTEIVSLKDELEFAQSYVYLLEQRFGAAYDFEWRVPTAKLNGQMIVPAALQNLLENVTKHNAGNQSEPLRARVELSENFLLVENEIRAKTHARSTSNIGLENLTARYAFLTEQPVKIERSEKFFRVKLPLLKLKK